MARFLVMLMMATAPQHAGPLPPSGDPPRPRIVEPAPQPMPVDGNGEPIEVAPAPARLLRVRGEASDRESIPEEVRDRITLAWDAQALGPTPEAGRLLVVLEPVAPEAAAPPAPRVWSDHLAADRIVIGGAAFDGLSQTVDLAADGAWWPARPEDLSGKFRIDAILDPAGSWAGLGDGGSPISGSMVVELDPARADTVDFALIGRVPLDADPRGDGIVPVSVPVEGGDLLRAAVVLPSSHPGDASTHFRWPVVLMVPDARESWQLAADLAPGIRSMAESGLLPQALYVVMDPRSPGGHHAAMNSLVHGAVEDAVVDSLMPLLAERFGASTLPEDRAVAGVGVGGFGALRLAATRPEAFSAAFVVEPMMAGEGRLGECVYADVEGSRSSHLSRDPQEQAAEVQWLGSGTHRVVVTVADEIALERVLSPRGGSGRWFDLWNALLSPALAPGSKVMAVRPLVRGDGQVDSVAARAWGQQELSSFVGTNWASAAEPISRSWALVPARDAHMASDGARAFFEWFDARCAEEARQGRSPPSGQGGMVAAGDLPRDRRWMALLSVLGPRIRDHFRASLRP